MWSDDIRWFKQHKLTNNKETSNWQYTSKAHLGNLNMHVVGGSHFKVSKISKYFHNFIWSSYKRKIMFVFNQCKKIIKFWVTKLRVAISLNLKLSSIFKFHSLAFQQFKKNRKLKTRYLTFTTSNYRRVTLQHSQWVQQI